MSENRRDFLKRAALAGGATAFVAGYADTARHLLGREAHASDRYYGRAPKPEFTVDAGSGKVTVNPQQQVSYTACLGCTTQCGVRVRIDRASAEVLRVAGNPYSPLSADPPLPYKTPVAASFSALSRAQEKGLEGRATACGRGNAALEQMRSPYRVTTPLKRVGPRNGGRWQPIAFEQLVRELAEGGDLFGEGHVDGLRTLRDFATPIDPAQPALGPRVNQVGLMYSVDDGRLGFARRFMQQAYGSINFVGHGAYCGGAYRSASGAVFGDMKKMPHAKPDLANAEFCLFVGTAPGNAGNPFKRQGKLLAKARTRGKLKYVVIDPVLTQAGNLAAASRQRWIPIRPGTDGALGMAMLRWLFENEGYDERYLAQPNQRVAEAAGEASWCNATHLVVTAASHPREGRYLRGSDLGLALAEEQRYTDADPYVVIDAAAGKPVPHEAAGGPAELFFEGEIEIAGAPLAVCSALSILRAEAMKHSIAEYAAACGIPEATIVELAQEFARHGKRSVVNVHGGMMAGNGYYNALSLVMLNVLAGNLNRKGGLLMNGGGFKAEGEGPRYKLESFAGQVKPTGTPLGRNAAYEKSAEFARNKAAGKAYPARAPWYPNATQPATEWLTGALDGYPYGMKALFVWSTNPLYGVAGLRSQIERDLVDPKRLPLIVAIDPFINETSAFADYIVPDSLLYESWGWAAPWNGVPTKCSTARWPVVEPAAQKLADGQAIGMETFLLALAQRLGLPGFGADAIADADGKRYPLARPEDWYLRAGANVAFLGKEPVPDATDEDLLLSGVARLQPALQSVLKEDEWRKVGFVLARGGRYQAAKEAFTEDKPDWATHRHTGALQVYHESVASTRNALNGRRHIGTATWTPPAFADGTTMRERYPEAQWPLLLSSFKSPLQSAYSIGAARLRRLHPENPVALHPSDAKRFGVAHGDAVWIETPGGRARATVLVREGVMPGVMAVEHGFGHRELGARAHRIGETRQPRNAELAAGFNLNDVGLPDPTRSGRSVWLDPVAGSAVRNGLPARIEPV